MLQIAITVITAKKLNYSVKEQLGDALCALVPTAAMSVTVIAISFFNCGPLLKLCLEIAGGVATFVLVSVLTKNRIFKSIFNIVRTKLLRNNNVNKKTD